MNEPGNGGAKAAFAADRTLWRGCQDIDAPEDDAEWFLDLAAFAEGRLDPEEKTRVAALIGPDQGDIETARRIKGTVPAPAPRRVVRRAITLVKADGESGRVIRTMAQVFRWPVFQHAVEWGSLAAALVLASWLGFAMGSDASLSLARDSQTGGQSFLAEMLEPSSGFLQILGEDVRT